jgi:LytR cell envelope-related transcriptional attenuator/cell envelope-related transcriptional attenuator-like protein
MGVRETDEVLNLSTWGEGSNPQLGGFPPAGTLEGRVAEQALENPPERPRRLPRWMNPRTAGAALGLFLALIIVMVVSDPVRRFVLGASAPGGSPSLGTMVWSVRTASGSSLVVVISEPAGRAPLVIAIPAHTSVDLPGGGASTVGDAAITPGMAVAATQATLNIRVPHHLVIDEHDLQALVDRLGGIQVDVEALFQSGHQPLGPGLTRLLGTDVAAYLSTATDTDDLTARWEDVLAGLMAGPADPGLWTFPLGQTDDVSRAARMLAAAHGAAVGELPTAPSDGTIQPDLKAIAALVRQSFAAPGVPLVRVVVLNGNGRPGMGALISARLSLLGFRVVAAQNAPSFRMQETQVVAADEGFLPQAEQVVATLQLGKVYVGAQPTGIADVTIIVGKDFGGA